MPGPTMGVRGPERGGVVHDVHSAAAAARRAAAARDGRAAAGVRGTGAGRARPGLRLHLPHPCATHQPHARRRVRLHQAGAPRAQPRSVARPLGSAPRERVAATR